MFKCNQQSAKTRQEKLDYLNSLDYSIVLRQKENNFYLSIPEICLIAKNTDLEAAYRDLFQQKKPFLRRSRIAIPLMTLCSLAKPIANARKHSAN